MNIFVKKLGLMYIGVVHAIDVLVDVTIDFDFLDFKYEKSKSIVISTNTSMTCATPIYINPKILTNMFNLKE